MRHQRWLNQTVSVGRALIFMLLVLYSIHWFLQRLYRRWTQSILAPKIFPAVAEIPCNIYCTFYFYETHHL